MNTNNLNKINIVVNPNLKNSHKKQFVGIYNGSTIYATEFEENTFPYEKIYPKVIVDLIKELNEKYGFPIEFTSVSTLVAFATAIGSTTQLKFKNDFIVFASLYVVLVGSPGTAKSHPIKFMFKPIWEKQAMYYKEYQEELEEYNTYDKLSKKDKETQLPVTKPSLRIITLDNYTLETLLLKLSENPKGLSVVVDELNSFFENMNRYNSGSDSETYNSLWSAVPITVTRKTTESFYIPPTPISIFGSMQPAILNSIFSKGKDKNGLTARFLFAMPSNLLPRKWTFEDIDEELIIQYRIAIQKLLDTESETDEEGKPIPRFIKFTDEAFNRIVTWHNGDEFYNKIIEDKGSSYYEAIIKLDNYALRFALILQMIYASVENESSNEVGIRAVENSILLVNYFMKEVINVHKLVYAKDIRLDMSEKQREIYEILPPTFHLCQMYEKVAKLNFTKDQLKKFVGIPEYFTRIGRGNYNKNFLELSDD